MLETENPDIYRVVLETLQSGILMLDRGGRIAFWNEGAERISGYRRHEVVGHLCQHNILTHCDEHRCNDCGTACPYASVLQEGKPKSCFVYVRHKDGHRIAVQAWTAPIRNSHGSVIGVVQNFSEMHVTGSDAPAHMPRSGLSESSRLPDRQYCELYLHEELTGFAQYRSPFGILRIHAPSLREIATRRGREAEDALVRRMVVAAHEAADGENFFGRWTADEFLMLVASCSAAELAEAAGHLQESLNHITLHWWGDELSLNVFVTQSVVQPGDTIESLLQRVGFVYSSAPVKSASAG